MRHELSARGVKVFVYYFDRSAASNADAPPPLAPQEVEGPPSLVEEDEKEEGGGGALPFEGRRFRLLGGGECESKRVVLKLVLFGSLDVGRGGGRIESGAGHADWIVSDKDFWCADLEQFVKAQPNVGVTTGGALQRALEVQGGGRDVF
jgi:hypothetical protein